MNFVTFKCILHKSFAFIILLALSTGSMAQEQVNPGWKERGGASFYADKFNGRPTSSGEKFNNNDMTCAHRTLPFGTVLKVTDLNNGKSVVVRVNDRGPFKKGRIVDLSKKAAQQLGIIQAGVGVVEIELHTPGSIPAELPKEPLPAEPRATEETIEKPLYEDSKFQMGKSYSIWATERKAFGFGLQVGSFGAFESARHVGKAILNEGFEAVYIQCGIVNNTKVFRVLVNQYVDKKDGKQDIKKLEKMGFDPFMKPHFNN